MSLFRSKTFTVFFRRVLDDDSRSEAAADAETPKKRAEKESRRKKESARKIISSQLPKIPTKIKVMMMSSFHVAILAIETCNKLSPPNMIKNSH